ncbi:hypothetical protein [Ornithinimicrobium pekingense]|uniref:DUF4386 family protein n=1 Tax=Ornithinimicrobium pekingense TaxID=384677 RepID=A0ABQ2F7A1_9MICO|nr:hypothetical protein [Ornithinimicrobium pekingense]GGK68979.1 hypothetical protein GCM10011509_16740 [Ornithinimicrobium pekingense]
MSTASLTRTAVAAALVVGVALTVVSVATMPDFSGDQAERLQAVAASPRAPLSAWTWVLSQPLLGIGVVGVAHLARRSAPVLATLAAVAFGLGVLGHAVYGGINLAMLAMAEDLGALEAHVAVLDRLEGGLMLPFMAAGLLGTVLGVLLLAATTWRAGLGPRWVGPALVVWVVVEFVGSGLVEWAGVASGALLTVAFGTLAATVWRSSITHWQTAAETTAAAPDAVTV